MIDKLTKEQEKGIKEWQKHCLKIGYDTSLINKEIVEKSWKKFYKILGKKEPMFWYCQSPLQAQIIINIFPEIEKILQKEKGSNIWSNIGSNIRSNIWSNIGPNIWSNIGSNIRSNIGSNIGSNIRSNIRSNIGSNIESNIRSNIESNIWSNIWSNIESNIGSNIGSNIWSNIGSNIGSNIWSNIRSNIRSNIESNIWSNIESNIGPNIESNIWSNIWSNIGPNIESNIGSNIRSNIWSNINKLNFKYIETYSWCQHDINWIGYYKYYEKYGLLPYDRNFEIFDIWYDLACSCGWCYTFENIVFVCKKPTEIHLNSDKQLHKNGNMALKYSDGYGLYMLNGVNVPRYLAITPESKLDIEFFKKEKNADIKAEFIKKYGIDRMKSLGKIIDTYKNYNEKWWTKSQYELIDMSSIFSSINYAPFLNMKNLTTGTFHLEGVEPSCKTISGALQSRWKRNPKEFKIEKIK